MILNYPGGSNVITRVLTGGGGGRRVRDREEDVLRETERERKEEWKIDDSMILALRTARVGFPGGPVPKTPGS